jgi:predicted deacylase
MNDTADKARPTRVSTDIDMAAEGRQCGFLRLPHSVHRSAYGWLPVPIVQFRNGSGPQVLLLAGNHGDEYEGQVILCKLIRSLDVTELRGRLVILPMANFPAAEAGLRTSPIDGGNLNRSFPGNPDGSPTEVMAHFIEHILMPGMDAMLDLHSGGSSLHYLPTGLAALTGEAGRDRKVCNLLEAFGLPYGLVFGPNGEDRMSSSAAARQGLVSISTELGGSGTVSPDILEMAEAGLRRALIHLGCFTGVAPPPSGRVRFLAVHGTPHYCYATEDGLFEPFVDLGETVEAGQPAGAIHFPETPWRAAEIVTFKASGLVVCKRVPARTRRGDCLYHLASDIERP